VHGLHVLRGVQKLLAQFASAALAVQGSVEPLGTRHAPVPSHDAGDEQVLGAVVSWRPIMMGEQVPMPLRLHAAHALHAEVLQQTPSAQKVLVHSVPSEHAAPLASLGAHVPVGPGLTQ